MDREILANSRILIVDDQEINVLLLERALQQAGYKHCLAITDSRQIVDRFRAFQPDLILLDLMMPRVDGYSVMKQLNGWIPSGAYLPILVVTADISRNARQQALRLGAKDFLTKPIDLPEMVLRVYNLLLTRWLYRQMESRNQFCAEQAFVSKERLEAALHELDRISTRGQVQTDELAGLRSTLMQAMEAIGKLSDEAAGGALPVSSMGSNLFASAAASEQGKPVI
jgi:putative two-component system response regulator